MKNRQSCGGLCKSAPSGALSPCRLLSAWLLPVAAEDRNIVITWLYYCNNLGGLMQDRQIWRQSTSGDPCTDLSAEYRIIYVFMKTLFVVLRFHDTRCLIQYLLTYFFIFIYVNTMVHICMWCLCWYNLNRVNVIVAPDDGRLQELCTILKKITNHRLLSYWQLTPYS